MDFESMKIDCSWKILAGGCMVKGLECTEDNCAPFHWAGEIVNRLWVSADVKIRTD